MATVSTVYSVNHFNSVNHVNRVNSMNSIQHVATSIPDGIFNLYSAWLYTNTHCRVGSCVPSDDVFIQPWFLMTRWPSAGQEQYSLPLFLDQMQIYPDQHSAYRDICSVCQTKKQLWMIHRICAVLKTEVCDPSLVCKQNPFCPFCPALSSSSVCFLSYTTQGLR